LISAAPSLTFPVVAFTSGQPNIVASPVAILTFP
jgi:hypothetical protein